MANVMGRGRHCRAGPGIKPRTSGQCLGKPAREMAESGPDCREKTAKTTTVKRPILPICLVALAALAGCERQPPDTPMPEALSRTLSAMHGAVDELKEQVVEINRQLTEAREAPTAAGVNALRLAGECQASLIATSLVYAAADEEKSSRDTEAESRDLALVEQWRERHGIGNGRFEAAVGVAMLRFLERHRTYGVTESAKDDTARMVELNRLHDACEAMRLFAADASGTGADG